MALATRPKLLLWTKCGRTDRERGPSHGQLIRRLADSWTSRDLDEHAVTRCAVRGAVIVLHQGARSPTARRRVVRNAEVVEAYWARTVEIA